MAITRFVETVPSTRTKKRYEGVCDICDKEWNSSTPPSYIVMNPMRLSNEESTGLFWCDECCKALKQLGNAEAAKRLLGSVVIDIEFATCYGALDPYEVESLRLQAPSGKTFVLTTTCHDDHVIVVEEKSE